MATDVVFRRINGRVVPIRRKSSEPNSKTKVIAGAALVATNHPGKRTIGKSGKYNINRVRVGNKVKFEARKPFRPFSSSYIKINHGNKTSTINMVMNRGFGFSSKRNFHNLMKEATADLGNTGRKRFSYNVVSKEGLSITKMGKTKFRRVRPWDGYSKFASRDEVEHFLKWKNINYKYSGQYVVGSTRIPDKFLNRGITKGKWGKGRAAMFVGGAALIGSAIYDWSR